MLFARLRMPPNRITVLWALLGIIGVIALGWPSYFVRVAGAVLLQISYLLDYVDGEVARLLQRSSKRGFLLDLLGHGVIKAGLFLAVGYRQFLTTQQAASLLLAFVASASLVNVYALPFLAAHAGVRNQPAPSGNQSGASGRRGALRELLGLLGLLFESPGLYALVLITVLSNKIGLLLLFYGILTPLWLLWRVQKYRFE